MASVHHRRSGHVQDPSSKFVSLGRWCRIRRSRRRSRRQPVVNQSSECSPGAIAASSSCEDPEDPGILRRSPARGYRREAGFVVRIGEGETTSASSSIGETDSCRAKKRLLQHDAEALRKAEHDKEVDVQGVADGEDLLQKLKLQADPAMSTLPPADPVGEVARLQQMVVELQRQLQHHGVPVVPQGAPLVQSPISLFRIRKREDYVPATEHEVLEWMADRHEDMTAALTDRNTTEAARISSLITDANRSLHPESVPPSMVTNMVR